MLPEEESLPGSELAVPILDREGYGRLREDGPDMGRHVVRALEVVDERGVAVRDQTSGEEFEVASHARVGVLANDQRSIVCMRNTLHRPCLIRDRATMACTCAVIS